MTKEGMLALSCLAKDLQGWPGTGWEVCRVERLTAVSSMESLDYSWLAGYDALRTTAPDDWHDWHSCPMCGLGRNVRAMLPSATTLMH